MREMLERHKQWRSRTIRQVNPLHGMSIVPIWVSHDRDGKGELYQARLHAPQHFSVDDAIDGVTDAAPSEVRHEGDVRWISMRIEPHGDPCPIQLFQVRKGDWEVVGGAGGRLNGLIVTGLIDDARYAALKRTRLATNRKVRERAGAIQRVQYNQLERKASAKKLSVQRHSVPMSREQAVDLVAAMHQGDEGAMHAAINLHPASGKIGWLKDYIGRHPGHSMFIYTHAPGAAQVISHALQMKDHPVYHTDGEEGGLVSVPSLGGAGNGKHHIIYHDGEPDIEPDPAKHHAVHALTTIA